MGIPGRDKSEGAYFRILGYFGALATSLTLMGTPGIVYGQDKPSKPTPDADSMPDEYVEPAPIDDVPEKVGDIPPIDEVGTPFTTRILQGADPLHHSPHGLRDLIRVEGIYKTFTRSQRHSAEIIGFRLSGKLGEADWFDNDSRKKDKESILAPGKLAWDFFAGQLREKDAKGRELSALVSGAWTPFAFRFNAYEDHQERETSVPGLDTDSDSRHRHYAFEAAIKADLSGKVKLGFYLGAVVDKRRSANQLLITSTGTTINTESETQTKGVFGKIIFEWLHTSGYFGGGLLGRLENDRVKVSYNASGSVERRADLDYNRRVAGGQALIAGRLDSDAIPFAWLGGTAVYQFQPGTGGNPGIEDKVAHSLNGGVVFGDHFLVGGSYSKDLETEALGIFLYTPDKIDLEKVLRVASYLSFKESLRFDIVPTERQREQQQRDQIAFLGMAGFSGAIAGYTSEEGEGITGYILLNLNLIRSDAETKKGEVQWSRWSAAFGFQHTDDGKDNGIKREAYELQIHARFGSDHAWGLGVFGQYGRKSREIERSLSAQFMLKF